MTHPVMQSEETYVPPPPTVLPPVPVMGTTVEPISSPPPLPSPIALEHRVTATADFNAKGSWLAITSDVITYPVRADGWFILIPGSVIGLLVALGMCLPLVNIFALAGLCFFGAYYMTVVEGTVEGKDLPPDWPGIDSPWDYIFRPSLNLLAALMVSITPALLLRTAFNGEENLPWWAELGGDLFTTVYAPMAVLSLAVHGSKMAVFPHVVIPAIFRTLPGYILAICVLAGVQMILAIMHLIASLIPLLGAVLAVLVSFYGLICQARLTGLLYRRYDHRLNW